MYTVSYVPLELQSSGRVPAVAPVQIWWLTEFLASFLDRPLQSLKEDVDAFHLVQRVVGLYSPIHSARYVQCVKQDTGTLHLQCTTSYSHTCNLREHCTCNIEQTGKDGGVTFPFHCCSRQNRVRCLRTSCRAARSNRFS